MSSLRPLSRRQVVSAGAWAAPAVVVASAAPSYATSLAEPSYVLNIPSVAPGQPIYAAVGIFGSAYPVAAGSVRLAVTQYGGSERAIMFVVEGWSAAEVGNAQVYTASASARAVTNFRLVYTTPAMFRFALTYPNGTITKDVEAYLAAGRVQDVPPLGDSTAPLVEIP